MHGQFITFEGIDGSGKTTQLRLLQEYLASHGVKCLLTREPGGSPGAEAIRQLLLTGADDKWNGISETLLFQAARVEHMDRVVRPALMRGETVLCDRFIDSTIVYQGISKKLGADFVRQLHQLTLGGILPDRTFILDIDPDIGIERARARSGMETRFESMDIAFHKAVRSGFLELAAMEPERIVVINADRKANEVHNDIVAALSTPKR